MTIDPVTSLAFSIHAQPGVFAVMLGSGVSRAADIPTGWGIVNDLLRQLAEAEGASLAGEPAAWYEKRFGEPVGFSSLLANLAPNGSDRQALLARYIEPREGENHRRPTEAHSALAELASAGFVRVFLTTNFDRLLEQALADVGIQPLVVSTPAAARGAPALQHAGVVVFKLHGDYRDPESMLVTEHELQRYDSDVKRLLDRVLEDYGLIACGWSGEWDPALRESINATRARRYSFYCAVRGEPPPRLGELIKVRQGIAVPIEDADQLFRVLSDRVASIQRANQSHPLDVTALAEKLKRSIAAKAHSVEIHDLVMAEMEKVMSALTDEILFPTASDLLAQDATGWDFVVGQVHRYLGTIEGLISVFVIGGAWAAPDDAFVWKRSIERIGNHGLELMSGRRVLVELRRLPLVVLVYAGAVAAIAQENYNFLRSITTDAMVRSGDQQVRVIGAASPWRAVSDKNLAGVLAREGGERSLNEVVAEVRRRGGGTRTPHSDFLHRRLREPLRQLLPDEKEYDEAFDRAEVTLAAIAADSELQSSANDGPYVDGPWYGRFTWTNRYRNQRLEQRMAEEAGGAGDGWHPLEGGLFGSNPERANAAFELVVTEAADPRSRGW